MDNYYSPNQYGRRPEAPRYDLCFVKGKQGAMDFEMGPNSRALLPDADEPVVWFVCTDELGRKSNRDKLGMKRICKYEFWAVMNSLYSDYGKTLAKVNATPEIYGELARDWIEDDDAVKAKAAAYFRYVVAHD